MISDEIKRSNIVAQNKSKLFVNIIKHVPDYSIWVLSDIHKGIWEDFKGINDILKYKTETTFSYSLIYPELCFQLSPKAKTFIIDFVLKNYNIWNYVYHQMIFKGSTGYMVAYEGFDIVDINNKIGITYKDIKYYKDFLLDVMLSDNVFD